MKNDPIAHKGEAPLYALIPRAASETGLPTETTDKKTEKRNSTEIAAADTEKTEEGSKAVTKTKRKAQTKHKGRRKIKIEYIADRTKRHITFSKRKNGILKKAYELATLTGTQVLLLVASETGHVYSFATSKLKPLVSKEKSQSLIKACLHEKAVVEADEKPPPVTPYEQISKASDEMVEPPHDTHPYRQHLSLYASPSPDLPAGYSSSAGYTQHLGYQVPPPHHPPAPMYAPFHYQRAVPPPHAYSSSPPPPPHAPDHHVQNFAPPMPMPPHYYAPRKEPDDWDI